MSIRIGEMLVSKGVLTQEQVEHIVEVQAGSARPFGQLAEELYNVDAEHIEQAWVDQYAALTQHIDIRDHQVDDEASHFVERRQAWQFSVMPVRFDGTELMIATTRESLSRALRFVTRCLEVPCYLVLTEPEMLGEALDEHYPMGGMSSGSVTQCPVKAFSARMGLA